MIPEIAPFPAARGLALRWVAVEVNALCTCCRTEEQAAAVIRAFLQSVAPGSGVSVTAPAPREPGGVQKSRCTARGGVTGVGFLHVSPGPSSG